jgi:branched-subunit amino acid ABC-type transport system permease component
MTSILLFALLGLGGGTVISLLALGVVAEYHASGVVNFAHGAMAMFCAYCFTQLRSTGDLVLPVVIVPHRVPLAGHGMATAPAMLIALVYAALFGVVVYLAIFRWLRRAPALAKVVASIGLMLTIQALAVIDFGSAARPSPRVLPAGPVTVLGATVSRDRLLLAAIAAASGVVLAALYRRTRFGVVTRACAQNERAAALLGWWPVRSELANWAIASTLAGLAGVLVAPITSLTPSP